MIYGRQDPQSIPMPVCPCCGTEVNDFYELDGSIVGCENCVRLIDAHEYVREQRENDYIEWREANEDR